jgi:hypothetical protein
MALIWDEDVSEPVEGEGFNPFSDRYLTGDSGYHSPGRNTIRKTLSDFNSYGDFGTHTNPPSLFVAPDSLDFRSSSAHTEPPPFQSSSFPNHREYHSDIQFQNSHYADAELNATIDALISEEPPVRVSFVDRIVC